MGVNDRLPLSSILNSPPLASAEQQQGQQPRKKPTKTQSPAQPEKPEKHAWLLLAEYQARWEQIHNDTVRQINEIQGM